uniref:cyclin-dependent kinase n=1 Tax=Chrysotila carterae TaxID=13221 RepID=A0A7S4F7Q6_CHRCT|mmetsp:Transcript_50276/g.108956  ORF Transcript_50276/g.108956 Transcript_50276/m.108956 type:complete len:297 (+) Transcript_50276:115-1005(+)
MEADHHSRRYAIEQKVGEGSFGQVFRARDRQHGHVVALKKVRIRDVRMLPAAALRELLALQQISHPNVLELLGQYTHGANLVLVMPFLPLSLATVLEQQHLPMPSERVREIAIMLLSGLVACHESDLVHRDIKPANLLIDAHGRLQIADFGQSRLLPKDAGGSLTAQVATRWYRAPELLFGSRYYGKGVDIWASGCVIAQLWSISPLLPGDSDLDQIFQVLLLLGSPSEANWPGVTLMPDFHKLELPRCQPKPMRRVLPYAPSSAVDLVSKMICYDPKARVSANDALSHAWLAGGL